MSWSYVKMSENLQSRRTPWETWVPCHHDTKINWEIYIYIPRFVYPLINRHLSYLYRLAVVNNAAMNIGVCIF